MGNPRNSAVLRYKISLLIANETSNKASTKPLQREILELLDRKLQFNSSILHRCFKMQDTFNKLVQTTITKLHPILVIDEDYWDTPIIHIWSQIQHKAYLCTNQLNLIISKIQASSIIIAKLKNSLSDPQWPKLAPTVIREGVGSP